MATKKSSVSAAGPSLEAEVAALKKEVAALKKQCAASAKSGSADPRLDKLIEAMKAYSVKWKFMLESAGL